MHNNGRHDMRQMPMQRMSASMLDARQLASCMTVLCTKPGEKPASWNIDSSLGKVSSMTLHESLPPLARDKPSKPKFVQTLRPCHQIEHPNKFTSKTYASRAGWLAHAYTTHHHRATSI